MDEFPEIQWTELSFSDDIGFQWGEVFFEELTELDFDQDDTFADIYFDDRSVEENYSLVDMGFSQEKMRGPFISHEDASQYASEISGAEVVVVYDEDIDGWWVYVGDSA